MQVRLEGRAPRCPWGRMPRLTARFGPRRVIEVMEWIESVRPLLSENAVSPSCDMPIRVSLVASVAAGAGHIRVLEWLQTRIALPVVKWDESCASNAAKRGQQLAFIWLAKRGAPIDWAQVKRSCESGAAAPPEYAFDDRPSACSKMLA